MRLILKLRSSGVSTPTKAALTCPRRVGDDSSQRNHDVGPPGRRVKRAGDPPGVMSIVSGRRRLSISDTRPWVRR